MSLTTKIVCDHCNADISATNGYPSYRLSLVAEKLPNNSNTEVAIHVTPPINKAHHFCGLHCLDHWVQGQRK